MVFWLKMQEIFNPAEGFFQTFSIGIHIYILQYLQIVKFLLKNLSTTNNLIIFTRSKALCCPAIFHLTVICGHVSTNDCYGLLFHSSGWGCEPLTTEVSQMPVSNSTPFGLTLVQNDEPVIGYAGCGDAPLIPVNPSVPIAGV